MCPAKPLNVLITTEYSTLAGCQYIRWFHRAHCLRKNTSPLKTKLDTPHKQTEISNKVVGVIANSSSISCCVWLTRSSVSLASGVCLVWVSKDLCSSLNNVPGETTACIDKQRVSFTLCLSIHAVVSPGTFFREEHKSFKNQIRHTTPASRNI